jgi:hypothetical protein
MADTDSDEEAIILAISTVLAAQEETRSRPRLGTRILPRFPKIECDWARIFAHGDNRDFLHLLMIDRVSFESILPAFARKFAQYSADGRKLGRKRIKPSARLKSRKMTGDGCLGLTLMWMASTCQMKFLALIFGIREERATVYVKLGQKLLAKVGAAMAFSFLS